jgi:ribosomal protein S18 acetylase RimI-like enzyme
MAITFKTTKENVNWEQVAKVLRESGLSDESPEFQKTAFVNSYAVVFIYDDDEIVGVGRALSDGISQGSIYNIAIDERYHGYGFGRKIIEMLLEKLKGQNVILYTHPQTVAFYENLGFKRNKSAMSYFDIDKEHLDWMTKEGFFLPEGYRFCDEYGRKDMQHEKVVRDPKELE